MILRMRTLLLYFGVITSAISAIFINSTIRYIKYLIPVMLLVTIPKNKRITLQLSELLNPFYLLIVYALVNSFQINVYGVKDIYFILSGLLFFILYRREWVNLEFVNIILILSYLILNNQNFNFAFNNFSLRYSTSFVIMEDNFSSIIGLFSIVTLIKKKWYLFFLNVLFMLIDMKRIVILSLIVVMLVMLFPKNIKRIVLNPKFMVLMNVFIIILLFGFSLGSLDDFVFSTFGMSPQWLSMGRNNLYKGVVTETMNNFYKTIIFGNGIGSAYQASINYLGYYTNLHSDILKIFFENGLIVFILFFYALHKTNNVFIKYFALYFNLNLSVDNLIIFSDFLFFYLLVIFQLKVESETELNINSNQRLEFFKVENL